MNRTAPRHHGFTLLEVLISVVVLAFGLLGVVAVFPAVIDVQRRSQDAVIGGSLAASAEAALNASVLDAQTTDWHDWDGENVDDVRRFPPRDVLARDLVTSVVRLYVTNENGINIENADVNFLWTRTGVDEFAGGITWGGGEAAVPFRFDMNGDAEMDQALPSINFSAGERLLPDDASGDEPRYVWDALVRRVDVGIGSALDDFRNEVAVPVSRLPELPIEVVVFVRPIDRGIRVPAGLSLRDTLRGFRTVNPTGNQFVREALDDDDRRFPVSVLSGDFAAPRPGLALDNGSANYSVPIIAVPDGMNPGEPIMLGSSANIAFPSTTELPVSEASAEQSLAQVGQLFVDDDGIVHRVTRVARDIDDQEAVTVEFEPPLKPEWRQIVFTPQVPADIRVIRTR